MRPKPATLEQVFVDRQAELALISRRLDDAQEGKGSFIAISGEPGIGKTKLAQAAAAAASTKGFGVFWGRCHEGQYVPPYWPWKQPLRDLLALLPGSKTSAQNTTIATALSEIVADVRDGGARPQPTTLGPGMKILESSTRLMHLVSERRPILLVMDNLHCADVPSLQLLQVVAREMRSCRVVMLGSHRDSPAVDGRVFRETLSGLAGESFFDSIRLSGWDVAVVGQCLKACGIADPSAHLTQAVHERTEGNPLFVMEVARLLQDEAFLKAGAASSSKAWERHIPSKVRLVILGLFQAGSSITPPTIPISSRTPPSGTPQTSSPL